jgi:hypothetical protein
MHKVNGSAIAKEPIGTVIILSLLLLVLLMVGDCDSGLSDYRFS